MSAKSNSFSSRLLHNAGIFNPVLVQAVGLCPVIAMATSLNGAALLAAVAAVALTLSEFIASAFLKVIPRWVRIGIYIIIGGGIVTPIMLLLEKFNPELFGSLGIYLPIMAVNSLLVLRCERFAVKLKPLSALADGFTASVGYAAVLILVGFFRELLGSGAFLGFKFYEGRTLSGLLLPFGGFLMLGFASAVLRAIISKFFPKYLDKKQPKPGHGKAQKPKAKKPAASKAAFAPALPDLTPEEDIFSLEEIAGEEHSPAAEPEEQEEAQPEPIEESKQEPEQETEQEAPTNEEEKKIAEAEETEAPAEEPKETSSFESISDDELDRLMNRSMDEVFAKKEKEDEK